MDSPGAATAHPPPGIPDHELLRPIGRGAYGEVWLARTALGTERAIKVVYRSSFESERPFEREFSGIQRFEPISRAHEGFVDILQVGRNDAGGYFYYVMELADDVNADSGPRLCEPQHSATERDQSSVGTSGSILSAAAHRAAVQASYIPKTLRSLLRPAPQPSTANPQPSLARLPIDQCVQIALTLTTALGRLHKEGLVHRDIKPSNIIFVSGVPKLADIGLVACVTEARSFVGTEGFIPPEGPGAPQADLYSLGKVLYEMSTGKDRHEFPELPTDARELPDRAQLIEFNEVVLKACHHDPQRRYQSAEEMHADLALLQSGKSVRHVRQLERRLERMKKYGLVAAALMLLAGGVTLFQKRQAWLAQKHADETERLLNRAVQAEQEGEQKLWQAYLAQARANRWSGKAGRRFDSLTAISNAALLPPTLIASNKLALRNEAVAAMALVDVRVTKELKSDAQIGFDHHFERGAVGGSGGEVAVRRMADGLELFRLPGHGHPVVFPPQFSPDGKHLAVRYNDETGFRIHELRVWNLERQEMVYQAPTPMSHEGHDFSADGNLFACTSRDGMVLVVEVNSWREVNRVKSVRSAKMLRFNPSATKLAVSSGDEAVVRIHDVRTGATDHSLVHHGDPWGLDWRPDGNVLATACGRHIHIWNADTGKELLELKEHKRQCTHVAFSHGGDLLASAGWDGFVRLWNPTTGQELVNYESRCWHLHFSPDDRLLAYVWDGGNVKMLEIAAGRECRMLNAHPGRDVHDADFSPDGRLLATGGSDGVRLWDTALWKEVAFRPASVPRTVLFHPDGRSLWATWKSQGLRRWPVTLEGSDYQVGPVQRLDLPEESWVAALSADGRRMAATCPKGALLLGLDAEPRELHRFQHAATDSVDISPDGWWVATGTWKGKDVKVWDARTGKLDHTLPVSGSAQVGFSPDGRWLVTANAAEYRFWEVGTWQSHHTVLRERAGDVAGRMCFARDGSLMAITQTPTLLKLVEPRTGQEIATLDAGPQYPLCFSPDGSQLVVHGGEAGTVQIWDLRSVRQQLAAMNLDWDLPPVPSLRPFDGPTNPTVTVLTNGPSSPIQVRRAEWISQDLAEHKRLLLIPSRDPLVNPDLIDLSAHYNMSLLKSWDARGNDLARLPQGLQSFDDIEFDVRGLVVLNGARAQRRGLSYPAQVTAIAVSRSFRRLHLLHSAGDAPKVPEGTAIASLVLRYADGQRHELPFVYGQHVRAAEVLSDAKQTLTAGALAWKGTNDAGWSLHIWKCSLENPLPDVKVDTIDYVSKMAEGNPYLIAMTVEGDTPPQAYPPHIRKNRALFVDLSAHYNARLDEDWRNGKDPSNSFANLPTGIGSFSGVEFDVRGVIQLARGLTVPLARPYPERIENILVGRKCQRLTFLHGTGIRENLINDGTRIGGYVIHYADGEREEVPIVYGKDVRRWQTYEGMPAEPDTPPPAWLGAQSRKHRGEAVRIRLYKTTWDNPRATVPVERIDFVSVGTKATPFLVAVTAEP